MNEATFIWSEIYEEFATKLLEYKNDRKNLISKLQNVYEEIDMKLSKMESNGEILDIDPFTIFWLFNKGITDDNRKRILGEIAKQLNNKNKEGKDINFFICHEPVTEFYDIAKKYYKDKEFITLFGHIHR